MVASVASTVSSEVSKSKLTAKKRRANRRNARKSTGPITPQGKAISAQNATSHGIYCRDVVLPGENDELFSNIREDYIDSINPQNLVELALVDRIAAVQWRIRRLDASEHELYLCRQAKHVDLFERHRAGEVDEEDDRFQNLGRSIGKMDEVEFEHACSAMGYVPHTLMSLMHDRECVIERYDRMRQRLEQSLHRAHRELRLMRTAPMKDAGDLPPSPYRAKAWQSAVLRNVVDAECEETEFDANEKAQNEPTEEKTATTPTPEKACGEAAVQESSRPCPEPVLRAALETGQHVQLDNSEFR